MKWLKELLEKAEIKDGKIDIDGIMKKAEAEFQKNAVNIEEFNLFKEKGEADIKQMQISHAVDMALMKANIKGDKAMAAIKALLNLEGAELDGNIIKGLDKQIEDLKADTSVGVLFGSDNKEFKLTGVTPAESGDGIPKNKSVDKMNYEELCAYMEANPNAQIN